jgi:hypothetical protein
MATSNSDPARPNGRIGKVCDELGDIEREIRKLNDRHIELREILLEESRRTKVYHFSGARYEATTYSGTYEYIKYKDAFDLLVRKTQTSDEERRKILKSYTKLQRNRPGMRCYIPKYRVPKER